MRILRRLERERKFSRWKQAIERSRHWEDLTPTARRKRVMGDHWYRIASLPIGAFIMGAFGMAILASYQHSPS